MNLVFRPLFLVCALSFCAPLGASESALNWQKTELFFGLSRPKQKPISPREWENFAATQITPRFPDGFTVMDGVGQWRGKNGKIAREKAKILLVVHPKNAHFERAVQKIIAAY